MLTLIPALNEKTLEPLTCLRSMLEIEVAGSTLQEVLEDRWSSVSAETDLSAAADFWPSRELIRKIFRLNGNFSLRFNGREVARAGLGEQLIEPETDDKNSFEIRYPWNILQINEDALAQITPRILGTVREQVVVDGILVLGENSVILPGVYIEGTVVIGKNCKIGPNCYIRGTTYLGDNVHVGQAVEVKNSILMHKVAAGHLSYIGDSIICPNTNFGAGTILSNFRHDGKNHRSMVNGELIDTGRRKFGAILGDGVHTGIHSSVYPGRKIWPKVSLRPGTVVQKDITEEQLV